MDHIARSHSDDYQILVRSADRTDIANLKWLQENGRIETSEGVFRIGEREPLEPESPKTVDPDGLSANTNMGHQGNKATAFSEGPKVYEQQRYL